MMEIIEQYPNPRAMAMLVPDAARAALKAARAAYEATKERSARLEAAHTALIAHLKKCGATPMEELVRSSTTSQETWLVHGVEVRIVMEWASAGQGGERFAIAQRVEQAWEMLEDTGRLNV